MCKLPRYIVPALSMDRRKPIPETESEHPMSMDAMKANAEANLKRFHEYLYFRNGALFIIVLLIIIYIEYMIYG